MNVSWRWIRELVPGLELTPLEMADTLASVGAPVDEVVDIGGPLRDVLIGRVVEAGRHPNADRLSLCTVDDGSGTTRQVVCGAPNVKAGAFYPFAPVGSSLPGGVTLRRAKIRGVESEGMLCSARELGLGRDHEGILELHGDFEPGASFIAAVGLEDARLLVDVTPNRPDLLSHVGIARELAAAAELQLVLPAVAGSVAGVDLSPGGLSVATAGIALAIDDADLCPQYIGLVIRGVRVGPSPEWLASRIRAIGLRPISNVVDVTNYVLHEFGQPLHAFDLELLGGQVRVRRARAGEHITTLDGVDRALAADMLVIADDRRPVAIAGVMGGADTEVRDSTRDILLECALFDPRSVRTTRRALNLGTDASYRFERGVDPDGLAIASLRAAALLVEVAAGTVETTGAWASAAAPPRPPLTLRTARVEQILGEAFTAGQLEGYLRPLGFADIRASAAGTLTMSVPGHRSYDVTREEDVIEEIARRHGYDSFPDELRPFRPGSVPSHPLFALEDRIRTLLVGRGLLEAHTAAFSPEADGDVALMLPLAATESRLRRALLPGLLRRVEYNFARGARSIRLFELGTVFAATAPGELPAESLRLAIALTGHRTPPHWTHGEPDAFDVWDLKALAAELAVALGLLVAEEAGSESSGSDSAGLDPRLETDLSFRLLAGHNEGSPRVVGRAGRVRRGAVDAPAWAGDVWAIEVELDAAMTAAPARFVELPAFPAIERDFALLVPDAVPAARVLDAMQRTAGSLLQATEPFDVYSGTGVPDGTRSVAVRLRFRAPDRTLTDREVDDVVRKVLRRLNDELGVKQRA
jgi:phenylalanyl-tRNA synthetase beta chain